MMDTFAASDVGIGRWGGHFEGQAIGPLEGVTVSDEESPWFLVLQNSYGYRREDTLSEGKGKIWFLVVINQKDCMSSLFIITLTLVSGDAWLVPELRAVLDKLSIDPDVCFLPTAVLCRTPSLLSHRGGKSNMVRGGRS